jgi:hypothetical protein
MPSREYRFITNWRIDGEIEQIRSILSDPLGYPRWWPSVFLSVASLESADGDRYEAQTRGWLPVSPRFRLRLSESEDPLGFVVRTDGDMTGVGVLGLSRHGDSVNVSFDWQVTPRSPMLRMLALASRPLYSANHRWAMSRGKISLEREIALRSAASDAARSALSPPPGPMPATGAWATVGLVLLSLVLPGSLLLRLLKPRSDKQGQ